MKILGQEVDPYELFLILILLLAGTGFFTPPEQERDPRSKRKGDFPSFFEFLANPRGISPTQEGTKKAHKLRLRRAKTLPMGAK